MRKNKISKIAILTSMLMINTNTKGFYQCVPKQDWFRKQYYILTLEDKFRVAKTQLNNGNAWDLVYSNKTSGVLDIGIYLVIVIGGSGGRGYGDSYISACTERCYGGYGGYGEFKNKLLFIKSKTSFTATIGTNGKDAEWGSGGDGTASSIRIGNETIVAHAGGGGKGCVIAIFNNDTSCSYKTAGSGCRYRECYGARGNSYNWSSSDYQYYKILNIHSDYDKIKIYKYIG